MTFKTLRRRGASLFLALTMCVSLLQVPAYAVDEAEEAAPDINVTVVSMNDAASTGDTTTPAPETTTPESTAPEASTPEETEEFDLADTQRPEQTDDISVAPGAPEEINPPETPDEPETPSEPETPVTPEDPSEPVPPAEPENPGEVEEPGNTEVVKPQDKNWDIFYDAERDVYKVTFKIDEDAEATEQVIDLTQALELLGQYAQLGKQEMEQAKAELEKQKPVMPSIEEPTMPDVTVPEPTKPEKPVAPDAPQKPDEPQKPTEPGMTNELKASLDQADSAFLAYVANDNRLSTKDNAEEFLREQGLDTSDKYVQSYAKYLVEKADAMDARNALEANNDPDYVAFIIEYYSPSGYWDDDGNRVTYTQAERLELAKADLDKTINNVPEYKVDKDSQAYKDYETALEVYNEKMEEYQAKLNEYKAAQDAYEKEHGVNSPEYKAYLAQMAEYEAQLEQYTTAKAEAAAQYAADIAAYLVKLANLQAKYDNDMNAYNAAVKELNEKYTSWAEANVLQPGDIRKFELFLTSDSKHTYKYQSGSFTLATPDLKALYEQLGIKTDGLIIGFDGQELGGTDLRPVEASVSYMSKPMLDLFDKAGIPREEVGVWLKSHDFRDVLTGWYDSTTVEQESALHELLGIEKGFSNEELRTAVEQWVIGYYSKDGTTYKNLADLVANNPQARADLSSTTGNTAAIIGGSTMSETLSAGFNYDNFYQSLFSFAFGDEKGVVGVTDENGNPVSMSEFLGNAVFNPNTGFWEYGNKSWTDNGYQMALYYYMDHQEIWEQTDKYFQTLLDNGLSADQATWASLMMAVNIDGALTSNGWQDTLWPWYSSIKLDRMDIDFSLKKTDSETNETITSSETEFSVYYIDTVKNDDGTETKVNMYCTYDEATGSYTFVPTVSTVWTKNGELNIDYAMMKDIVYYLQEMTAPEGYDRDTNVYIVMDEETYNNMSDEDKSQLGEFDKFLDMTTSEDGLTVNVQFVNSKTPTPPPEEPDDPTPPPTTPDRPDRPTTPPTTDIPDPDVPLAPGPDPEEPPVIIEEPDVPLAELPPEVEIPEPEVPLAGQPPVTTTIPEPEVPLADVPMTGDASGLWYALMGLAACGLVVLNLRKKEEA